MLAGCGMWVARLSPVEKTPKFSDPTLSLAMWGWVCSGDVGRLWELPPWWVCSLVCSRVCGYGVGMLGLGRLWELPPWWGLGGLPGSQLLPLPLASAAHQHSPKSYISEPILTQKWPAAAQRLRELGAKSCGLMGQASSCSCTQSTPPQISAPILRALPQGFRWYLGPLTRLWVIVSAFPVGEYYHASSPSVSGCSPKRGQ